jgi:hypothetical protein
MQRNDLSAWPNLLMSDRGAKLDRASGDVIGRVGGRGCRVFRGSIGLLFQKAGRSICDGVVIGLDGDEPHRANLDFGRHGRGGVFVSANARRIEDSQHDKLSTEN